MALRQIRIGSLPNVGQYDDGDYSKSISTETPIECTAPPVDADDVVRLDDLGSYVMGPAAAVDSNIVEFDGITGKVVKDGGLTHAGVSGAVSSSHNRSHNIISPFDHSSTATSGKMLKADANGLPVDATNTDAAVAGAVSASHARSHAISSTSDHSDVNLAGISNDDLMQWDDPSSKWEPKSIAEVVSGNSLAPGPVTIGSVEDWRYAAAIADDGTKELPTIAANYAAQGNVIISSAGIIDESAEFEIDSTGTCQIIRGTANVVVNADTDTKLCLGTAAAQNPLTIKNRLGGAKNIMITMMYVKA